MITISSKDSFSHPGINLNVIGQVDLKLESDPKDSIPPRPILNEVIELRPAGKFAKQTVEKINFAFPLTAGDGRVLLETYHGVYVSIMYVVNIVLERGKLKRKLEKEVEFIVEVPVRRKGGEEDEGVEFCITPESCDNVEKARISSLPKFKIIGKIHHKTCLINLPFTGEIKVELSETPIDSIELELVRCESVSESLGPNGGDGMTRECTEVQTLQIATGDVTRDLVIPIYMVFPRIYAAPSCKMGAFQVEFEINLLVTFENGYVVSENFPIKLVRTS